MDSLTIDDVNKVIKKEQYHHFPGTTMTVCCLELQNGFTVTGESACVNPDDFNEAVGKRYAREMAVGKVFDCEAYMMKQKHFCFGGR